MGDEAAAAASQAVRLEGLAQHRVAVAVLLERAGRTDEAVAEIRLALTEDRQDPFVQLNGAVLLASAGQAPRRRQR